jgi:hypothetical protein
VAIRKLRMMDVFVAEKKEIVCFHKIRLRKEILGSISPTFFLHSFYAHRSQKSEKIKSSVSFGAFGICQWRSCALNVGYIDIMYFYSQRKLFRGHFNTVICNTFLAFFYTPLLMGYFNF